MIVRLVKPLQGLVITCEPEALATIEALRGQIARGAPPIHRAALEGATR